MTIAYFDCFSGVAGDMILGALIDLGIDIKFLDSELKKLHISGFKIDIKKVEKNHISATDIFITVNEHQHKRNLSDILNILKKSKLNNNVKNLSKKIFQRIAKAESKIHNISIDQVHFHEIGAVDSIIDIIGSSICLDHLNIKHVYCSKIPLGSGFTKCSHGIIPIPAPATVELLKNVPVYQTESGHEMVTPTGAAIITTIAEKFNEMPPMKIKKIGYGAGKIISDYPGLLRIFLGELE
jgi:uncharacterized protein (TIGR00299 family) protein